jgi:enoyl-[acyl-carrier protein] reductase/trans-2-enoyl-CoA reductase (NAD+)
MAPQIVKRKSRGFICINAHPEGCRLNVERQVSAIISCRPNPLAGLKNVLVIGASTGYGLASRIAASWAFGASTIGVFFERPPDEVKTASAGYYNTCAFHEFAKRDGFRAASINGDAFSDQVKRDTIEIIRRHGQAIDMIVYSLASPRRVHPKTGEVFNSVLKPVGKPYSNKNIELDAEKVTNITIEPASEKEIADTVAVMGGDDWGMWIDALLDADLLAPRVRTVAYSYIGPELTWPIYKDGTIGHAKKDLQAAANRLNARLLARLGGRAWVAVNKAVVTQASAAIPVVPLYLSLLPPALRSRGLDEGPIQQMQRLFFDYFADGCMEVTDDDGRIRLDDREMLGDVQADVAARWPEVTTENLREITAFGDFQRDFRQLFGFEVPGVDYEVPVETDVRW